MKQGTSTMAWPLPVVNGTVICSYSVLLSGQNQSSNIEADVIVDMTDIGKVSF